MNTQTHILIAAALLAKNGKTHRRRNTAILLGALVPDILIFIMAGAAFSQNVTQQELWGVWYFQPPWQTWIDAFNSIPIYSLLLITGLFLLKNSKKKATYLILFTTAALLHIGGDLPLHVDDGHAHFWPFNQWRYESSVSYWDPAHSGNLFGMLEALLGIALSALLWKRFKNKPDAAVIRSTLLLFVALYALVPIYFFLTFNQ